MDGMLDPHDRRLAEAWEILRAQQSVGDIMAPESNRLAFADPEFLLRRETRGIRFQLEMMKPDLAQQAQGVEHTVVVFGSARFRSEEESHKELVRARDSGDAQAIQKAQTLVRNARYYEQARAFGNVVTKYSADKTNGRKLFICTGGGPGIMEAANRGAYEAGGISVGLNIALPHEQTPNPYITPSLSFKFHYFALRKMHFLLRARAIVVYPGGFGSFDEIFEVLTLIQTKKIRNFPVIVMGKDFHKEMMEHILLMKEKGTISLEDDQLRRDFTVNALAISLNRADYGALVDPFNGVQHMQEQKLQTPLDPAQTFSDDPLRMMRAIRFATQLGYRIEPNTYLAIQENAARIRIVSQERITDELNKIMLAPKPSIGWDLLYKTGLLKLIFPQMMDLHGAVYIDGKGHKDNFYHTLQVLDNIAVNTDDLWLRWAALLHDIGKPKTRALIPGGGVSFHHHEVVGARLAKERLKKLRYSNEVIDDVETLISLHLRFHGYGDGEWTDSAVRRYVRDAGELLTHLHVLTRADCTTRNQRKAELLAKTYDELESRIARLAAEEELAAIRPDLDGAEVMELLKLKPSREVGLALDFLLELRLEHGPLGKERATTELLSWWQSR